VQFTVSQRFFFDAAHTLKREIEAEGSRRIHGHSYHAEVWLAGPLDPTTGMVVDLGHLRKSLGDLRERLDHHMLDEVPDLGPQLTRVRVWREAVGDACTLELNP